MINNVTLVGRMTRDAELRHTPSNQPVATFNLAVMGGEYVRDHYRNLG